MVESENIQVESGRKRRRLGPVIALIALIVVVAGGAFAYNSLAQSGSRSSGVDVFASAQSSSSSSDAALGANDAAASGSGQVDGDSEGISTSSTQTAAGSGQASSSASGSAPSSRREGALYLSDRDSTVFTESGAPLTLSQIADGKPLVMNFWATWCPYCIQEMDDFQAIYNDYGDRVSFAFIDCVDGQRETVQAGATWMREQGLTLPAYYDTRFEAVRDFGASSLPTTVVVGADDEILAVSVGAIDPTRMRNALDALLES